MTPLIAFGLSYLRPQELSFSATLSISLLLQPPNSPSPQGLGFVPPQQSFHFLDPALFPVPTKDQGSQHNNKSN